MFAKCMHVASGRYVLVYGVMPAVIVGWISPWVFAATKYGIGIRIQSLHWVVDNSLKHPLISPPDLPPPTQRLANNGGGSSCIDVGGGSSKRSILMIKYVRLRLKVNVSKIWCGAC